MYKKQLLKLIFCPLFLLLSSWAMAQDRSVSGTVTDEKGQELPGVTVSVKGTQRGTNSDTQGKYSISANSNSVLVFTMVGYLRQEVKVGSQSTVNVTLSTEDKQLN